MQYDGLLAMLYAINNRVSLSGILVCNGCLIFGLVRKVRLLLVNVCNIKSEYDYKYEYKYDIRIVN